MITFNDITKEHNPNWSQIPDHPYRILIIGDSGSGKQIHYLMQKVSNQILTKYLYVKDAYEAK